VSSLHEKRQGGQMEHAGMGADAHPRYQIDIEADRIDAFMKHAFVLNPENGTNIALMTSGAFQSLDALYGHKAYGVDERNAYASLMFETNFHSVHNLSTGLSLQHDYLSQRLRLTEGRVPLGREKETVAGAYAQYTYQPSTHLTAMAGLRIDDSSLYGTFLTPRAHLKVQPADFITLRLSAGKGFRTTHALAQYNNLLASGRQLAIDDHLDQEEAWNYGASANFYIPLFGKTLKLNAEYNYTDFRHQTVVDYDSDPERILVTNLNGDSRSHVFQVDASYPFFKGFNLTAAWRWNDVKTTYGGRLRDQILTSKYKGLITASYETDMRKWQFDVTLQLNGSGRLPDGYPTGLSHTSGNRYKAFEQLSAQVTREFRHFSVYVGGENLTGVRQKQSILNAATPWTSAFEPTLVWGPVHGAMAYAGIRITL
jgi:outer membrane receptor protein involved in Fe transport